MLLFAWVVAPSFIVAQYNVLAGYLGDNRQPWFLHGLLDLPLERRNRILHKFYERHPVTGELLHAGWPTYVEGILSEQEQETVERVHDECFAWPVRRPRLLATVRDLNADLLSLVECDHYDDFWKIEMQKLGYEGIYKRRPGRSQDGCAIFYRPSVFELEASQGIEFLGRCTTMNGAADTDATNTVPSFGDRVALLVLLRHIQSGRRLIFISTHLARNPEDPNKTKDRARQMAQLLYQLTRFATEHNAMPNEQESDDDGDDAVPAMIAGDMNETNLRHIATIARIKCGLADEACHPLVFASRAPRTADTSVTAARQMCIDYLVLQSSHLAAQEALEPAALVSREDPIPNQRHPSDHLPIAFRIAFLDYDDTVRELAESWWNVIIARATQKESSELLDNSNASSSRQKPLRLDELRMAFGHFDKDGDGLCAVDELHTGLAHLCDAHGGGNQEEIITKTLDFLREKLPTFGGVLPLTDFTTVYIKSWLQSQDSFLDRVESLQTILDLDLSDLPSQRRKKEAVDADELLDSVIHNYFGDYFFRSQVRAAFSFFDFDASGSFDMMELYQSFSTACPFDVKAELIQDIFDGMGKGYDEKISLDEFADFLVSTHLSKDPTWVSFKTRASSAVDGKASAAQWL
eukprot:scaffold10368_cov180-Amphora_coffeaeformis.AAC.4